MPRSAQFGAGIHTVDPHVNGRMSFEKRMQQEAFIPGAHRPSVVSVLLPSAVDCGDIVTTRQLSQPGLAGWSIFVSPEGKQQMRVTP